MPQASRRKGATQSQAYQAPGGVVGRKPVARLYSGPYKKDQKRAKAATKTTILTSVGSRAHFQRARCRARNVTPWKTRRKPRARSMTNTTGPPYLPICLPHHSLRRRGSSRSRRASPITSPQLSTPTFPETVAPGRPCGATLTHLALPVQAALRRRQPIVSEWATWAKALLPHRPSANICVIFQVKFTQLRQRWPALQATGTG
jgi:hypothetical protein